MTHRLSLYHINFSQTRVSLFALTSFFYLFISGIPFCLASLAIYIISLQEFYSIRTILGHSSNKNKNIERDSHDWIKVCTLTNPWQKTNSHYWIKNPNNNKSNNEAYWFRHRMSYLTTNSKHKFIKFYITNQNLGFPNDNKELKTLNGKYAGRIKQIKPYGPLNEIGRWSYHANVGVVTEARLADDGKIGALPAIGLKIPKQPMRHARLWLWSAVGQIGLRRLGLRHWARSSERRSCEPYGAPQERMVVESVIQLTLFIYFLLLLLLCFVLLLPTGGLPDSVKRK